MQRLSQLPKHVMNIIPGDIVIGKIGSKVEGFLGGKLKTSITRIMTITLPFPALNAAKKKFGCSGTLTAVSKDRSP